MTSDYRPIPCETYAELEVAIMQGARLRVCWSSEDGMALLASLVPVDLRTRHSEEFLVAQMTPHLARNANNRGIPGIIPGIRQGHNRREVQIRLDRIRRFVPI